MIRDALESVEMFSGSNSPVAVHKALPKKRMLDMYISLVSNAPRVRAIEIISEFTLPLTRTHFEPLKRDTRLFSKIIYFVLFFLNAISNRV